ncbi:MAG: DUF4259 domain-containing protein [Hymenobacter sp.]|nr:MAG: DUF4259 domain-containing protein [Hymenobacter sp.]
MAKYYLNPLNFSNPKAASFLSAFKLTPTEDTVANMLVVAAESNDFVEPTVAANTLAAAEIVATSLGRPSTDFPIELLEIVHGALPALEGCKILASDAISIVMDSVQDSVAMQDEANDFASWEEAQQNLLHRLT